MIKVRSVRAERDHKAVSGAFSQQHAASFAAWMGIPEGAGVASSRRAKVT